jgi:structural maintenance of chromosome 1
LKDCEDQLQTARKKAQRLSLKFEKVKTDRLHKFEECYKHVSSSLQVIYKDLTKSSKHPMGGTAFLTLDNTNDPYTGGTRFTAMPPMKRFRDMDQLSGGEKTMAALALLFSIHSFRQAPFFVLDEVDAALDNVNVKKICNYIKQRSQDFQCIVISLKDSLFEHANSLVGVAKDIEESTSKVYTLSLREFEDLSLQAADRSVSLNESSYDQSTSQISMQQRSPLAREQKGRTPQSAGTTMRGIPEEKRASPDSGGSATGKRKQR